ncbi:bacteriocin [Staphylococcus chromogenes]|uniref:Bacteriocin n=1 Tax=Staphylococcus chromogenes TaxID=46126 RepID=A0ABD5AYJ0_STACR|nr:bacteriocin [Staphylococcus chromogenes]MCE4967179.1 bacteriocin [Staphylococcus chromogenes]MDQ7176412.1 bacteriocin [Staphylococcus chromogenes]PTF29511.1 bacteriocin [Staphylococcus chromogenes]PTF74341.1 bacteriocin [Staphylococcus chromogenes]PTF75775.1 bacteriocin [Staphylococcus chromogenes]
METLNEKELKDINGGRETGCSGNFEEDGIMCNIGQGIGNLVNKITGK